MGGFPEPRVGLVICYSYLWTEEAERGLKEGRKDRPCAVVVALQPASTKSGKRVAVVPLTHTPPHDLRAAIEVPTKVKEYLGLDGERSWIVLDELNVFTWPGFDLRSIRRGENRIDYGMLPPALFDKIIAMLVPLLGTGGVTRVSRE
jgi:hypothetical protein